MTVPKVKMPKSIKPAQAEPRKTKADPVQEIMNEPGPNAIATIVDNRSCAVFQRRLQKNMDAHAAAKAIPLQRKAPKGSARFQQIATDMGAQYGVDTSGLRATHHSAFPAKINAEATIQGSNIHFAPGKDTDENIRHEVAHAIDNALHGTPKGDQVVNGQKIDTTRERIVGQMAIGAMPATGQQHFPLQKTDALNQQIFQLKHPGKEIVTNKLNVVGENHEEQTRPIDHKQTRRDYEKEYAKKLFGCSYAEDCYWKEHELLIENREKTKVLAGDDQYLRFITFLIIYCLMYKANKRRLTQDLWLEDAQYSFARRSLSRFHDTKDDHWKHEKALLEIIDNTLQNKNDLKRHDYLYKKIREYLLHHLQQDISSFQKHAENLLTIERLIVKLRSTIMHETASITIGRGIWKVGNTHVNDIAKLLDNTRNYNLLTKEAFDEIINQSHRDQYVGSSDILASDTSDDEEGLVLTIRINR